MATISGLGKVSGAERRLLRKAFGIGSHLGTGASLHYLGGAPVVRATPARQEGLAVASWTELVAFLRRLTLVGPTPPPKSTRSTEPISKPRHRLGTSRSDVDGGIIEQASANWHQRLHRAAHPGRPQRRGATPPLGALRAGTVITSEVAPCSMAL